MCRAAQGAGINTDGPGVRLNPLAVANVCVVIACFAAVARMTDVLAVWALMSNMSVGSVIAAVGLHAIIIALLAIRWSAILAALDRTVSTLRAMALTFLSTTLNLVLPTSVGGDLGRVWLARGDGVDSANGTAAAVFDRAIGLIALVLLVLVGVIAGNGRFAAVSSNGVLIATLVVVALVIVLLMQISRILRSEKMQRFGDGLKQVVSRPGTLLLASTLSLISHILAACIAAVIAQGMGLDFTVWAAVLLFPAVLLAALMPVSVGGWGVRELAAIPLLAQAGIDAESATAIAIVFGITQLIAAGVGSLLGFARRAPAEIVE